MNWQSVLITALGGVLAAAAGFLSSHQLARIARRTDARKTLQIRLEDIYIVSQKIQESVQGIISGVYAAV